MEDASSGDDEEGGGLNTTSLAQTQQPLSDVAKRTLLLANRRASARRSLQFALGRLEGVLAEQRAFYSERFPDAPSVQSALSKSPSGQQEIDAKKEVEAAYALMESEAANLKSALERVRRAEVALNPSMGGTPAVVAFAVSGPGTTWADDVLSSQNTHLPRVVHTLGSIFLAAYSSPVRTENKPKRSYPAGTTKTGRKAPSKRPKYGK